MYSIEQTINAIKATSRVVNDSRHVDYTRWGAKQDLYRIMWVLEEELKRSPKFSIEDDWLKQEEKRKILKILSAESKI